MNNIIPTINKFFISVDSRDWADVAAAFCDEVLLDYTSMTGGEPAWLRPEQIIGAWKGLLPGFDKTHHQLGNFLIEETQDTATAFFYGTASHYLVNDTGNNLWVVVGSYEASLALIEERWRIKTFKFNFKFMVGNNDLAAMAQERVKKSVGAEG